MRNLGMGKKLIEEKILEELHLLAEMIKSFKGELGRIKVKYYIAHIFQALL